MNRKSPEIRTVSLTEAHEQWTETLTTVRGGHSRVVLEQEGEPVAVLISLGDFDRLLADEAQRERDFAVIDRMRVAFADVPDDEIERELVQAIAEVRVQCRADTHML